MHGTELAIFGGVPAFQEKLHVGQPNLAQTPRFLEMFEGILEKKWLTNDGEWVRRFEAEVRDYLGVKHCIAVANGTLGLEIAARALFPAPGDIIVPSFTFAATPHALAWQRYRPVFADIKPRTHVLDPVDVEIKITEHTVGILGVHTWGTPCEIEVLTKIAKRYRLSLFFDAAHAFGCAHRDRSIGNFGTCEVFSFHATKFFNTAEGGAVTTNDDRLAQKLRELRNFGFVEDGSHRTTGVGINAKMSEFHAAVGLGNLSELQLFIDRNRANYQRYWYNLEHSSARMTPQLCHSNFQYVVIELLGEELSADDLVKVLQAENVLARRYFSPPCHRMLPYDQEDYYLPVTELVSDRVIVLPTGMAVEEEVIDKICQIIFYYIRHALQITERLGELRSREFACEFD